MKSIKNNSPRDYISWTQLNLIETNPSMYYWHYIEGKDGFDNKYMRFGSRIAKGLELGYDEQRDPVIESILLFAPQYPKREFEIRVSLPNQNIPLFGKLDGWDTRTKTIGEYKTGKNYIQSTADKSGQLTFYALMVWIKYGCLPKKIFLHWLETAERQDGSILLTGKIKMFETKRTIKDITLFSKRISNAWNDICELGRIFKIKK